MLKLQVAALIELVLALHERAIERHRRMYLSTTYPSRYCILIGLEIPLSDSVWNDNWRKVKFLDLANDLTPQGIDPDTPQRLIKLLWKRSVYVNIEDKLFRRWAMHLFQLCLPEISFPEVISVHKYSMGVLYYTGGWLLSSLNKAGGKSPEHKQGLSFAVL